MNRLLLSCVVLVFAAISIGYFWFGGIPPCRITDKPLDGFATLSFQLLSETNAYLISLATLLLGSLGVMGMKITSLQHDRDCQQARWMISIAGVFAVASLYFAFDSHINLAETAINHCTDFGDKLVYTQLMQVLTLLLGVIVALYFIFVFLGFERKKE